VRLLIDTHIALWSVTGQRELPTRAVDLMLDPENEVWVSVISIWEAAIKHASRRRADEAGIVSGTRAAELFDRAGFALLPVLPAHAAEVDHLPHHHRDPFDRMLIAQARAEPMHLVTADKALAAYGDHVLLV
jgi:PIN domain nuclease of toxin-antitoxin system